VESERAAQGRLLRVTAPRGLSLYPTFEAGLVAYAAVSHDLLGNIPEPPQMLVLPAGAVVLEVGRRGSFLQLHTALGPGWLAAWLADVALAEVEEGAQ